MAKDAPERVIETAWGSPSPGMDVRYLVDTTVVARSRSDLVRDLAEMLARERVPLVKMDSFPKGDMVTLALSLQVTDGDQLKRVLSLLSDVKGVSAAHRA
jgi:GTP pyrophosphokinase